MNIRRIMLVAAALTAMCAVPAMAGQDDAAAKTGKAPAAKTVTTASGLKYTDVKVGKGASPVAGKMVKVHYTGTLVNGKKFDSSVGREPFTFTIGVGQVIPGWDEGVMGMKVGGKRKLIIPANLGYGARGAGADIPPNATLLFDVELIDVQK
jgi:peptidylprolyl isomerase